MSLLTDHTWKALYDSDEGDLIEEFFEPALTSAIRYDRSTGYYSARVLTLVARGIEGLLRNNGRMRLLIGCVLHQEDVDAIEKGYSIRDTAEARLLSNPLAPSDEAQINTLELLSWMIAKGYLDVKVAIPCDHDHKPKKGLGIFHSKSGIIEDRAGNRLVFRGSINETPAGWLLDDSADGNWEDFSVFTDWGGAADHVNASEEQFAKLWADKAQQCMVIDLPIAVRDDLLKYLPKDDKAPKRMAEPKAPYNTRPEPPEGEDEGDDDVPPEPPVPMNELRRLVWNIIWSAPMSPNGGERIGEVTSTIEPWPHQVRAFQRMYDNWPPRLLIADEVGLGKTIEAGLLLRQALLSGRAKRVLVLAPRSILSQWQIELREKFNLNWPIYDGQKLSWYPSRGLTHPATKTVAPDAWHREPCVLVSSQLMRRADRARELLDSAEPYDIIVLDEAHHARRRGAGGSGDRGPNQLLRLMQRLKDKTAGLILMTATPMQVHPVEVYDLLRLIGLPEDWSDEDFEKYFELTVAQNPADADFERIARLFRSVEMNLGQTRTEDARVYLSGNSKLGTDNVLKALRDNAQTPRRRLSPDRRHAAQKIMRANSPVSRLISRHTRELLRRYFLAGKLSMSIATRNVVDEFVTMTTEERNLYEAVEDYISTTYNRASTKQRNAIGFIMTVYRKRVASSFLALRLTLGRRLAALESNAASVLEDDVSEDDATDDVIDFEEALEFDRESLEVEERAEIEILMETATSLPTDSKALRLLEVLQDLKKDGYSQAMVFTQFTDTLDFLREYLTSESELDVLCFTGRGGEYQDHSGHWNVVTRDDVKRMFAEGKSNVLLCTDAAAEGLNFQFCGAVINYDMPWNPMKVEQRIGRIDRLGQEHPEIRIVNLNYDDTVETDVYVALRERIGLFSRFVGKLQPILGRLPQSIAATTFLNSEERRRQRGNIVQQIESDVAALEDAAFDLDDMVESALEVLSRPNAPYNLTDLDVLLNHPELLPDDLDVKPMGNQEYELSMPGLSESVRITTNPQYYDAHPESTELWSPGSMLFPYPIGEQKEQEDESRANLRDILSALE